MTFSLELKSYLRAARPYALHPQTRACVDVSTPPKILAVCQWACNALIGTLVLDFRPVHKNNWPKFCKPSSAVFPHPCGEHEDMLSGFGTRVRITHAVARTTPLEKILSATQALDQFHHRQTHAA